MPGSQEMRENGVIIVEVTDDHDRRNLTRKGQQAPWSEYAIARRLWATLGVFVASAREYVNVKSVCGGRFRKMNSNTLDLLSRHINTDPCDAANTLQPRHISCGARAAPASGWH
jgi:hypothetical protein